MMKRKNLLVLGIACAAAVLVGQIHGSAVEEIKRLAALMEWKPGTVAATPTVSPVKALLRFGEVRSRVNVGEVETAGAR